DRLIPAYPGQGGRYVHHAAGQPRVLLRGEQEPGPARRRTRAASAQRLRRTDPVHRRKSHLDGGRRRADTGGQRLYQRIPHRTPVARCQAVRNRRRHQRNSPHADWPRTLRRDCLTRQTMIYSGDVQHIEPAPAPRPEPLAVARQILAGFDRHYALVRYSDQRAKALFESGDWHGIQQLSRERIEYYDMRVRECVTQLRHVLRDSAAPEHAVSLTAEQTRFWQDVKQQFVNLLAGHRQPECAETFFNSVSCRILQRDYFHNDYLFVRPAIATDYLDSRMPSYRVYYPLTEGLRKSLIRMVADFGLAIAYADLPRDARLLARAAVRKLRAQWPHDRGPRLASDCQVQVLSTLFF